jgi:hypothetical protein
MQRLPDLGENYPLRIFSHAYPANYRCLRIGCFSLRLQLDLPAAIFALNLRSSQNTMADSNEEKKEEVPAFRFSEKKVDDSWKEEVRRERELAAKAGAAPAAGERKAPPSAKPAAGQQQKQSSPDEDDGDLDDGGAAAPAAEKSTRSAAEQQQSKIFMNFLAGLAQQTLMQLGEIESPFTGQREVDLQGARYTIELLSTIQNKTKGNLTPEEESALKDAIHDLKMRYVEVTQEVQRQMQAQAAKGGPGGGAAGGMRPGPGGTIPGGKRR